LGLLSDGNLRCAAMPIPGEVQSSLLKLKYVDLLEDLISFRVELLDPCLRVSDLHLQVAQEFL
jgi:hypothetical protein